MDRTQEIRTVYVCQNVDCGSRGSPALLEGLKDKLQAAQSEVHVEPYLCFGACDQGPNVVLYPEGTWYRGVQAADLDEIVEHVLGGQPPHRLAEGVDPTLRELIREILDLGLGEPPGERDR